jgi:hypothetical protein
VNANAESRDRAIERSLDLRSIDLLIFRFPNRPIERSTDRAIQPAVAEADGRWLKAQGCWLTSELVARWPVAES